MSYSISNFFSFTSNSSMYDFSAQAATPPCEKQKFGLSLTLSVTRVVVKSGLIFMNFCLLKMNALLQKEVKCGWSLQSDGHLKTCFGFSFSSTNTSLLLQKCRRSFRANNKA